MLESPTAILRQVAKTAVLVGCCAMLLYGAVVLLVQRDGAQWIIGLALAAPLAAMIGWFVVDALRSGVFPALSGSMTRDGEPGAYWFNMAWFAACGVLLVALAGWCAAELLGD